MITIDGLTVQLGGVRPLSDLTVQLDAPIHGVIGPNGAGKTTLLNVLSGLVRPASGRIACDGVALHRMGARRRARWGVRRTFQTECLAERLSARANVAVAVDATSSRRQRAATVERALALTGIADPERPVATLDGFQRRLVEIARALAGAPQVVLLDEPAGGLSGAESAALATLVRAIPEACGAQVVLVDHDVELIAAVCPRVTVLDFGEHLATGATRATLDDDRVRAAWLGNREVAA
ncbi:Branched-chain amino acid transport ATP-binding protein LivG (TC 3.A.1.4.1) [Patulibacter medicamentivorans]|uniref:Branched-chain amino acid transport ATP-binding protein LivG (TC 3.A.1.4.1) n=1 Tax=Patulibacter medicamentivorans TaxID=1097667 RepID=H0E820_9ACTN|nr:ATP-binding cassette domain-containing protein [Patulibacter medicamentivorans]EHN10218.1 Branched-chain amino acid transport ATP-binding protein LivG (TC 3.A.1.4.1) [Patulibacter medicamentivorans]